MRDTLPMTEEDLAQILSTATGTEFSHTASAEPDTIIEPIPKHILDGYLARGGLLPNEVLGIPVDIDVREFGPVEDASEHPEDPSRAPTILNMPGLPPYKSDTAGFRPSPAVVSFNVDSPLRSTDDGAGTSGADTQSDEEADEQDLETKLQDQMLRFHEFAYNSRDENLYAAGFVATNRYLKDKLFVGIKSQFVFNLRPPQKRICFEAGNCGGLPPGFKVHPSKAVLRVAVADPKSKKAVVDSYDLFTGSALGRALKIHGIEGKYRAKDLRLERRFVSRELYNNVAFALADCGYSVFPLRSFEDVTVRFL